MSELPNRTHAEMVGLLDEVDQILQGSTPAGVMYVLYVIGGVVMSALFDGRLTQDIDVATAEIPATGLTTHEALVQLCDQVIAKTQSYQFERDWVSSVSQDISRLLARKERGMDITEAAVELAAGYEGLETHPA